MPETTAPDQILVPLEDLKALTYALNRIQSTGQGLPNATTVALERVNRQVMETIEDVTPTLSTDDLTPAPGGKVVTGKASVIIDPFAAGTPAT